MTAPARKLEMKSAVVACKASREDVKLPGDYAFVVLDGKRLVVLQCPCCDKPMLLEGATIVQDEPLSLLPSLECFCGAKYRIHQGKVLLA